MSLVKDSSIALMSKVITVACGLAIASSTAWLLQPVGCGRLAVYCVIGLLTALASSGGIEMAGGYYVGIKKYKVSEIVTGLFVITLISTLISGIVVCLLWRYRIISEDKVDIKGLIACVCYVPGLLMFTSLWYLHSALGYTVIFSVSQIIAQSVTAISILIISWKTRSPEYAMYAYVIGQFFAAFYLFFALMGKEKVFPFRVSIKCIKDLYIYGMKYYFGRVSEFVNIQLGTIIITFMGGVANVGYFSKSVALTGRIAILPEVLNSVLLSRVVKGQHTSLEVVAKLVRMVFWTTFFICIIMAIFSKPIVAILFSKSFYPIVVPIIILLPGMILRCCSKIIALYYNGIGHPEINSYSLVSAIIVNVILMYQLLPRYGIVGAAVATTCGYLVDCTVLLFFFGKITGRSRKILLPVFSDILSFKAIVVRVLKK